MKSNRAMVKLGIVERIEPEKGVFEDSITEKPVKAQFLQLYQNRVNQAMADGLKVTSRIRVRGHIDHELRYVSFSGLKFKVNSIYENVNSHFIEIELGEQM